MATIRREKVAGPRPAWHTNPRVPHTKAMLRLEPGERIIVDADRAGSARQLAVRWGKKLGRTFKCALIPGTGRLEIYREA